MPKNGLRATGAKGPRSWAHATSGGFVAACSGIRCAEDCRVNTRSSNAGDQGEDDGESKGWVEAGKQPEAMVTS